MILQRARPGATPSAVARSPLGAAARCTFATAVIALVAIVGCAAPSATGDGESGGRTADLILQGARVWTGIAGSPPVSAVAIASGRIVGLGSDREVLSAFRGDSTETLDLEGALIVPGFSDNHTHFASAARFLEFNIMTASGQAELAERLRDVTGRVAEGEWITGGLWGAYDQWAQGTAGGAARKRFTPDLEAAAELISRHPVFLTRFDGSEHAVNRLALQAAGIDPDQPDPAGIELVRDRDGRFRGILRGAGVAERFASLIPEPSRERRLAMTRHALAEIGRRGVTAISDMSDDLQLELFRELRNAGELTVRVRFRHPLDRWQELADDGVRAGGGDEWIGLGALKGHIDGIMGNSTARFFEPYDHDPTNRGRWRRLMVDESGDFASGQFLQFMLDADAAGLQLSIHAIGDEANSLLLDYLEELEQRNGPRDRRFRLVHAQVIAPQDFARLGPLGIVAEVQPFHLSDDMRWMEERIGRERCAGAYAFRSIRDAGATLSFGSDWPGTAAAEYPIDPLRGLYAAVSRQTVQGEPAEGWFADQRIDLEDALRAYTWGSAYADFDEDERGTIEVGKLADLTVLDRDLFALEPADWLSARTLYTIVDGEVVYAANEDREPSTR
ncbi:MAG TPA: amidohydrolase [Thermoanaerobaculia bacterium]|nr:amidohydrolase [Thermoanaerobaculia bacterium]